MSSVNTILTSAGLAAVTSAGVLGPYFAVKYFLPMYDVRIDSSIHTSGATSAIPVSATETSGSSFSTVYGEKIFNTSGYTVSTGSSFCYYDGVNLSATGGSSFQVSAIGTSGSKQSSLSKVNLYGGLPVSQMVSGSFESSPSEGVFKFSSGSSAIPSAALPSFDISTSASRSLVFPVYSYTPSVGSDATSKGLFKCRLDESEGDFKFNKLVLFAVKVDANGVEDLSTGMVPLAYVGISDPITKTTTGLNITSVDIDVELGWTVGSPGQITYNNGEYWLKTGSSALGYIGNVGIGSSAYPGSWYTSGTKLRITNHTDWGLEISRDTTEGVKFKGFSTSADGWGAGDTRGIELSRFQLRSGSSSSATGKFCLAVGDSTLAGNNPYSPGYADYALSYGYGTSAVGNRSYAFGYGSIAAGGNSWSQGYLTSANGNSGNDSFTLAMGKESYAGNGGISIGFKVGSIGSFARTSASNDGIAIGHGAGATGTNSLALQGYALALGSYSIAIGSGDLVGGMGGSNTPNIASAQRSMSFGFSTSATGTDSFALGTSAVSNSNYAISLGEKSSATGAAAVAVGRRALAFNASSVAIGIDSRAGGSNTIAIGNSSYSNADYSTAIGAGSSASNLYSFAIGYGAYSLGVDAFSFGTQAIAAGSGSVSIGKSPYSIGAYSIGIGLNTSATGTSAVSIGVKNTSTNQYSTAIGHLVSATGIGSFASGYQTHASGDYSFAAGVVTSAIGAGSSTMGYGSYASGTYSFAAGEQSVATGTYSFAAGRKSSATGRSSVALGEEGFAAGAFSVAFGTSSTANANGYNSFIVGRGSVDGDYGVSFGYGVGIGKYVFSMGNNINQAATSTSGSFLFGEAIYVSANPNTYVFGKTIDLLAGTSSGSMVVGDGITTSNNYNSFIFGKTIDTLTGTSSGSMVVGQSITMGNCYNSLVIGKNIVMSAATNSLSYSLVMGNGLDLTFWSSAADIRNSIIFGGYAHAIKSMSNSIVFGNSNACEVSQGFCFGTLNQLRTNSTFFSANSSADFGFIAGNFNAGYNYSYILGDSNIISDSFTSLSQEASQFVIGYNNILSAAGASGRVSNYVFGKNWKSYNLSETTFIGDKTHVVSASSAYLISSGTPRISDDVIIGAARLCINANGYDSTTANTEYATMIIRQSKLASYTSATPALMDIGTEYTSASGPAGINGYIRIHIPGSGIRWIPYYL